MANSNSKKAIDAKARDEIVSIAKKNKLYFVVWYGHNGNYFVAVENKSHKDPNIYAAMYDSYYNVVNRDPEKFKFAILDKFSWANALTMVKANMPTKRKMHNG